MAPAGSGFVACLRATNPIDSDNTQIPAAIAAATIIHVLPAVDHLLLPSILLWLACLEVSGG
jgi:hypothetical protein